MRNEIRIIAAALVGGAALAAAPAAFAHGDHESRVIIIGDDEDLLEKLIALDEQGILEMRAEIAEARDEIEDAMADIEEAREELKAVPGARFIVKIAFAAAREATTTAVSEALDEVRDELDKAEIRLGTMDVSDDERTETQGAIDALRLDLTALELSLQRLLAELRV